MAQTPLRSLEDILRSRPPKLTFNPPTDKPLDETAGGAPPYPLPGELMREVEGKPEGEISTTMSKFRTGLSEHRTRASEHRTDLSEHRTDLSGYRTELSSHRTDLSEHRTALSEHRTDLSDHRTKLSEHRTALSEHRTDLSEHRTLLSDSRSLLSNERTHLGYLRTGVSLMSFGITLNRFAIFLLQNKEAQQDPAVYGPLVERVRSTEQIGLGMVVLGVLLLLWSLYRFRRVNNQILSERLKPPRISVIMVTFGIMLLGALTTLILMVT